MKVERRLPGVAGISKISEKIAGFYALPNVNFFRKARKMATVVAKAVIADKTDPPAAFFLRIIILSIPLIVSPQILDHPRHRGDKGGARLSEDIYAGIAMTALRKRSSSNGLNRKSIFRCANGAYGDDKKQRYATQRSMQQ